MVHSRRLNSGDKHARPEEIEDDFVIKANRTVYQDLVENPDFERLQPAHAADEPTTPSLGFLDLPTELRLQIYRYCLISSKPIYVYTSTALSVNLLCTCKTLRSECAEILYGSNHFRFARHNDHPVLLTFLKSIRPNATKWLRQVMIRVPFLDFRKPVYKYKYSLVRMGSCGGGRYKPESRLVSYKYVCPEYATDDGSYDLHKITWSRLFKSLVDVLVDLPRLCEFTFLVHDDWDFDGYPLRQESDEIWDLLYELLHRKSLMHVSVVLMEEWGRYRDPSAQRNRASFLKQLRNRLGIWDQRRVVFRSWKDWEMPPQRVEEDPDEWLKDVRLMFV